MLLLNVALAADPAVTEVAVGLGGTGEAVFQEALARVYDDISGSLAAEVVVSARTRWPVEVSMELGFRQLAGTREGGEAPTSFWYAPVTLLVSGRYDAGSVALLAGAGPSWVAYGESPGEALDVERSDGGARPGVLFEASGRWHSPWLEPSLHHPDRGPAGLDLYVAVGYRHSDVSDAAREAGSCMEAPCGIDLSAARASVGALVRF